MMAALFYSLYHYLWSFLGAMWYRFPSRALVVVGVTGTNGKTTVVELTAHLLRAAGIKTAQTSSLRFVIGDTETQNRTKMTMPGRMFIQRFLWNARHAGATHAVLEVTSEGIRQHRHRFIDFNVAALTNIAPEHIEAHGGFHAYREAKRELFRALVRSSKKKKTIVVNGDDPSADTIRQAAANVTEWRYGIAFDNTYARVHTVPLKPAAFAIQKKDITFTLDGVAMRVPLMGVFNLFNALCAIAVARSLGVSLERIGEGLASFPGVPGRMEYIHAGQNFDVIVDYAHTPDALENVYRTIAKDTQRFICVLGAAGGGRDKWKRAELGKQAEAFCARVIITNEDPYDEDPAKIMNALAVHPRFEKILDRRLAIRRAFEYATRGAGEAVVITGKGAEPLMAVANGKHIPWDDRQVAREELFLLQKNKMT